MWQFKEACEGIANACEILNTPVVSGNVSLYNQSNGIDIYPTPTIGMVGIIEKDMKVIDSKLKKSGNLIILLGEIGEDFGGSLLLKIINNEIIGSPKIDLQKELSLWEMCKEIFPVIESAKNIKEGGIAIALAKMALLGDKGIEIYHNSIRGNLVFSETQSNLCIEVKKENLNLIDESSKKHNVPYSIIGMVNESSDIRIDSISISKYEARKLYFDTFKNIMES